MKTHIEPCVPAPLPADDSEEARQARRNAYYDKMCWCGHALGNHSPITGDCMLCSHSAPSY